jgi:hypothetical protein
MNYDLKSTNKNRTFKNYFLRNQKKEIVNKILQFCFKLSSVKCFFILF